MHLKTAFVPNPPSLTAACLGLLVWSGFAEKLPPADRGLEAPRTLNTLRTFPEIESKGAWERRAREIREQILVSCGLWPLPEKTPLRAHVFAKTERDGYSVEKVYFQTYPGFYLAGNLYRPLGKGNGPFPGVLNPHGHWKEGRLADTPLGSIAARCINFARQGMVAFSYDMVGYNDTAQVNHRFASDPTNQLWNISLMGLQTWNSIRALDFLESLPEVDKSRLACTGESGGGTQTFMLGAIDNRLAAQAPIVMVSHSMQGGCQCENCPGLRVDYSNMEIAAVPAPRPQILVAATGDWTKMTMEVEGPSIQKIYRLLKAEDNLRFVIFDFDHNYNRTSREAVYAWFGQWLLPASNPASLKEMTYQKEPDEALRVWPDGKLPEDALPEPRLIDALIKLAQEQWESLKPKDTRSFENFKRTMLPAWRHTLQVEFPEKGLLVEAADVKKAGAYSISSLHLGRAGKGDRIPAMLITPENDSYRYMVVLAHPDGKSAYLDAAQMPKGLCKLFLDHRYATLLLDTFLTGELQNEKAAQARKPFTNFFSTYNRTDLQERVQDLLTACAFAQTHGKGRRVILCGTGRAGLWSLLAAPAADVTVADCDQLDLTSDRALMEPDLFSPGLRRLGAFAGAASLAAPNPILVHNTGRSFSTEWLSNTYAALQAKEYRQDSERMPDDAIVRWVAELKLR
jgi:dienelactone hydrolase